MFTVNIFYRSLISQPAWSGVAWSVSTKWAFCLVVIGWAGFFMSGCLGDALHTLAVCPFVLRLLHFCVLKWYFSYGCPLLPHLLQVFPVVANCMSGFPGTDPLGVQSLLDGLVAASILWTISMAFCRVKSFSVNSPFWIGMPNIPQTSLSQRVTLRLFWNSQCSVNLWSCATYCTKVSPSFWSWWWNRKHSVITIGLGSM